jgi:hypothetical protein
MYVLWDTRKNGSMSLCKVVFVLLISYNNRLVSEVIEDNISEDCKITKSTFANCEHLSIPTVIVFLEV